MSAQEVNCSGLTVPQPFPAHVADQNVTVLDLFSLKGKVAIVTGGSAGIGKAVVEAYAQAGADIAVWYNTTNPCEEMAAMAAKYGVTIRCYQVVVTDTEAVEAAINQQIADFGKIDIFVANAGICWKDQLVIDTTELEHWKEVIDVDLNAVFYSSRIIGRHFKERGTGSLVITASMSGHICNYPQRQACYNVAKAGLIMFSKSLAVEWAGFARVNTVSPGYIYTNMLEGNKAGMAKWNLLTPMGRPGLPKELAGAYLFLASEASTYCTGTDLIADGGYTLV